MATEVAVQFGSSRNERLSIEDFETASIRSAAPSYGKRYHMTPARNSPDKKNLISVSEAPSYHSTLPPNESAPPYTPPEPSNQANLRSNTRQHPTPVSSPFTPGAGLPRLPSPRRRSDVSQLGDFRIPTWSTTTSNPTYARVAQRRAIAASSSASSMENALRSVLERANPASGVADSHVVRPLEDPYLVGEEAASRARHARLARERGDDILMREDRRWDFFLG
jgi:hypothetical protein